jgi:hypothetical protein
VADAPTPVFQPKIGIKSFAFILQKAKDNFQLTCVRVDNIGNYSASEETIRSIAATLSVR